MKLKFQSFSGKVVNGAVFLLGNEVEKIAN